MLEEDTPSNDCIISPRKTDKDGYPKKEVAGKTWRENRWVLTQKLGRSILPGMLACHTRDNPACINPEHIYEGTLQDNYRDSWVRGRRNIPSGDDHWMDKYPERISRGIKHSESIKQGSIPRGDNHWTRNGSKPLTGHSALMKARKQRRKDEIDRIALYSRKDNSNSI